MDDKDLEIARLKGRIEGMEAAQGKRPPPSEGEVSTGRAFRFVALLVGAIIIGFLVYSAAKPKESDEQRAQRIATSINATCDPKWTGSEEAAGECRLREFQRRSDEIVGR